jgi:hypothetical protein
MGNNNNKLLYNVPSFKKLRVYSHDLKLNKSINYNDKLNELYYFINNENYDIICIHGINNKKFFAELQKKLHNYNAQNKKKLSYYPELTLNEINDNYISPMEINNKILNESSVSQEKNNRDDYDSIIISKHTIISMSNIKIPKYICTTQNIYYLINIVFYNIIISIFNVSLQPDYVGIANHKIRKIQLKMLHDYIITNQNIVKNDFPEYYSKNITIISIQSNINNFDNNDINDEYTLMIDALESIDTFEYVQTIKYGDNSDRKNNLENIRSSYILLCLINNNVYKQYQVNDKYNNKSQNFGIINSILDKRFQIYEKIPLMSDFIIETNPIEPFTKNKHKHKQDIATEIE